VVVNVTSKTLGGYGPSEKKLAQRYKDSVGRDHLWVRKDEAEALGKGVLPRSLQLRIARFHLVDNTRGEPPLWRPDEVKELKLELRDGRVAGSIRLQTRSAERGYTADLLGVVEVKDGKVSRFDLLARGQFWGEGTFTRGAPQGKFPLAVAFTLSDGKAAADRVPPQAGRGNIKAYLRSSD
jgi:hypothetical protein